MNGKNIIVAITPDSLRDELLLELGHRGAKAFVTVQKNDVIKLLKTKNINCIITQMMLKNEDTIELVLNIQDIDHRIPVILIDKTDRQNHDLAKRLKVAAYFEKPVLSQDILQKLDRILSTSQNVLNYKVG